MAIIAGLPATHELRAKPLCCDELIAVRAPAARPAPRTLRRAKLEESCWIAREEGSAARRELDVWFHRHRLKPGRLMSFNGPDAVKRTCHRGGHQLPGLRGTALVANAGHGALIALRHMLPANVLP